MPTGWNAPTSRQVNGRVEVPGSKSMTNRALILAAQANQPSQIPGALASRDTHLMAAGLRALGINVTDQGECWTVQPGSLHGPATVDCGLAGTVMRFLPPLAATGRGEVHFDGDVIARTRPLEPILDGLRQLGVSVHGRNLPLTVHANGVRGSHVVLDASASSQLVSGLLLAAPSFADGVQVIHQGPPVPSMPHIDMTVNCLRQQGIDAKQTAAGCWQVRPGVPKPWRARIEPDLSNATVFLAAAAVTGGTVAIPGWPSKTDQAGDQFRRLAEQMGCRVTLSADALRLTGPDQLRGLDADLHSVGELTPTLAAMALHADAPSHLGGIGHLRGHETDRLKVLVSNITALGGCASADADSLTITPAPLRGGLWQAAGDHRIATAGAIVGLRVEDVVVDDIQATSKTLPGFAQMWDKLIGGTS